jgi:hypothetical protein
VGVARYMLDEYYERMKKSTERTDEGVHEADA